MFLSTPPSWVATQLAGSKQEGLEVSIHATLVGGDGELKDDGSSGEE